MNGARIARSESFEGDPASNRRVVRFAFYEQALLVRDGMGRNRRNRCDRGSPTRAIGR
jgi:hypothetical protein